MHSTFKLVALLLVLAAGLGYWNHRVLRLPLTVGLLVSAFGGTLLLIMADAALPELGLKAALRGVLARVRPRRLAPTTLPRRGVCTPPGAGAASKLTKETR